MNNQEPKWPDIPYPFLHEYLFPTVFAIFLDVIPLSVNLRDVGARRR